MFIYTGEATKIKSIDDIWINSKEMHFLKKNEVFYGTFFFRIDGLAPIWIKEICLVDEDGKELVDCEIYVFYDETQMGIHPSGGVYNRKQFFIDFSSGINEIENVNKLKEKKFEVISLTSQDECRSVSCKITYKVWNVFHKEVISPSVKL